MKSELYYDTVCAQSQLANQESALSSNYVVMPTFYKGLKDTAFYDYILEHYMPIAYFRWALLRSPLTWLSVQKEAILALKRRVITVLFFSG